LEDNEYGLQGSWCVKREHWERILRFAWMGLWDKSPQVSCIYSADLIRILQGNGFPDLYILFNVIHITEGEVPNFMCPYWVRMDSRWWSCHKACLAGLKNV
jgi:hypothetical protein